VKPWDAARRPQEEEEVDPDCEFGCAYWSAILSNWYEHYVCIQALRSAEKACDGRMEYVQEKEHN
jgi:hypothetical protein